VESELTLTSPTDGTAVVGGQQVTVTWTGILVPAVRIVLTRVDDGAASLLAVTDNVGAYEWSVPLDMVRATESLALRSSHILSGCLRFLPSLFCDD
jgi:hypothetical protein